MVYDTWPSPKPVRKRLSHLNNRNNNTSHERDFRQNTNSVQGVRKNRVDRLLPRSQSHYSSGGAVYRREERNGVPRTFQSFAVPVLPEKTFGSETSNQVSTQNRRIAHSPAELAKQPVHAHTSVVHTQPGHSLTKGVHPVGKPAEQHQYLPVLPNQIVISRNEYDKLKKKKKRLSHGQRDRLKKAVERNLRLELGLSSEQNGGKPANKESQV